MLKILIIDDEVASANMLRILIDKHIREEKQVECCNDPVKAIELVTTFRPSLLMLDIEMPGMNGFDFLAQAPNNDFDVIFTTAFDKYAIRAIRFSALDYLLKPVDAGELQNAIHRHIIKEEYAGNNTKLVKNLLHNLHQKKEDFKLAVSVKEGVFLFDLPGIICIEGSNNYSKFYFETGKPLLVAKTIGEYEDILSGHGFIRVHKSWLVNKAHIKKLDTENQLWLSGQMQVPVSRRRKTKILEVINSK
ncbi:LytTR family DNA-binding domain-containing protein [Flavihumibacter sediminis]|nr:LytTR family DNA-binding domain-containing protein [Flavihumibacter sediminis]